MRKFLTATLLCMALTVTMVPAAFAADTADSNYTTCMAAIQEQKVIQDQAHQTAESLRQKGYDDSSAYIQAAQSLSLIHILPPTHCHPSPGRGDG